MARGRPMKCIHCGGRTVSKGYRKTATLGLRRLKKCKDCGRRFTAGNKQMRKKKAR